MNINRYIIKKEFLYILFFLLVFSGGCDTEVIEITGNGIPAVKSFDLKEFHSIEQNASFPVLLRQGPPEVRLEGDSNMLDQVALEVMNGRLSIDFKSEGVFKDFDLSLVISLPEINELQLNRAGTLIFDSEFDLQNLQIISSGTGKIKVASKLTVDKLVLEGFEGSEFKMLVAANELEVRGRGSSLFDIKGTTVEALLELRDATVFEGSRLKTKKMNLFQKSTSPAEVSVEELLEVKIESTGDVLYKGNPEIDFCKSGIGELHKLGCCI